MKRKLKLLLLPVFIFFGYLFFSYAVFQMLGGEIKDSVTGAVISDGIIAVIGFLVLAVGIPKKKAELAESIRKKFRPKAWAVFLFFAAVFVLWFLTQCMAVCIMNYLSDPNMESYSTAMSSDIGLYVFLTIFLAPPCEEFVFRGAIYKTWLKFAGDKMIWRIVFAVLSSLLFAASHGTLGHLPTALLVGLFACALYEVTGSILWPILMHMTYNFMSTSVVFPVSESMEKVVLSPVFNILAFCILFAVILVLYVKHFCVRDYITSEHLIDRWNRPWDGDDPEMFQWMVSKRKAKEEPDAKSSEVIKKGEKDE